MMHQRFNWPAHIWILGLILTHSVVVHAGTWSAGGGEIAGDTQNPWFLQNTKEVHFCIRGDQSHFSLPFSEASKIVDDVLNYWHDQFKFGVHARYNQIDLALTSQKFIEEPCTGDLEQALNSHDLVIQLGELSDAQRNFLKKPRSFVAASVRTDYDPALLKGKGFIYVSPDSGELKYDVLKSPTLVDNPNS